MSKTLIVTTYVGDILIYEKSTDKIDDLIKRLKKDNIALHKEGMAESYLVGLISSRKETRPLHYKRG
jgi:hypothetical protein